MKLKKWIALNLMLFAVLFPALGLIQYFKGRDIQYSIEFGVLWAVITALVFSAVKVHKLKQAGLPLIK